MSINFKLEMVRTLLAGYTVVMGLSLGTLWHQSSANAEWTLDDNGLIVHNDLLGSRLWEITGDGPPVNRCIVSPWNSQNLLVGSTRHSTDGGQLLCLERASGDTIWTVGPDITAMTRAFGADVIMSAQFSCKQIAVADLDGDAPPKSSSPSPMANTTHLPFV